MISTRRSLLRSMFDAAIAAAQPSLCVPPYLPPVPKGRLIVIGAGKASASMARAVEDHWPGELGGIVVTRYGYSVCCNRIEIIEAAHPVPDTAGMRAAERIFDLAKSAGPGDTVLCLISGGASALLALPLDGVTLEDKQDINKALLRSGATISEMNCIRRHLSAIKGGRLAAAAFPANVVNLLISDIPGDDPTDIGSGPTVGDRTTCADAMAVIRRYRIDLPKRIQAILERGQGESVKPADPRLAGVQTTLVATPQMALEAAAKVALKHGWSVHILGDAIQGEARDVGIVIAGIVTQIVHHGQPFRPPCMLLSGGETTVTVRGKGRGGRNVEFLLSLGIALNGLEGVWALAGDTDGVDGMEEIAGAVLTPDSLARAWRHGYSPKDALADNNGHGFFGMLGDAVVTGPTLTNVNDFRAVLIEAPTAEPP